jgi:hypothetical protein
MTIDLTECRAKIERAREHRDALEAMVRPVISGSAPESDLVQLNAKLDPQSGQHVFRVATIPEDWRLRVGIILGDIVHNLRSALDYVFYALCVHYLGATKTERLGNQVQFPIEDNPQTFANKRVHFGKIPWGHWAIIDSAQPYNGADPPRAALRTLRNLSNRDKHRALNPLLLRTTMIQLYDHTLAAQATTDFHFPDSTQRALGDRYLEVGTEVMRVGLPRDVDAEMEVAGHITPAIQLPEMDIPMGWGVSIMISAVERITEGIAKLL